MRLHSAATLATIIVAVQVLHVSPAFAATTQRDDREMTNLAAQVISDAQSGREALASGKTSASVTDIDGALVARNKLAGIARSHDMPMVVPVYAELDETAVLTAAAKSNAKMRSSLSASNKNASPMTVRNNDAQLTYLAIDLDKAKAHLDAAKAAVDSHNDQAARDSLAAVGSDLVEGSVVTDLPLLTAREDLSRAQAELKSNDSKAASADLRQASKSLARYTTGDHVKDAQLLAAAIDASPKETTNDPTASQKIENWWSSVKTWFVQKA
jgi:hypothetical protein